MTVHLELFLLSFCSKLCLICSKIFKSPFSLPCGDTICEKHLNESQNLKNNSIKCQSCGEVFEVKKQWNDSIKQYTSNVSPKSTISERWRKIEEEIFGGFHWKSLSTKWATPHFC